MELDSYTITKNICPFIKITLLVDSNLTLSNKRNKRKRETKESKAAGKVQVLQV